MNESVDCRTPFFFGTDTSEDPIRRNTIWSWSSSGRLLFVALARWFFIS